MKIMLRLFIFTVLLGGSVQVFAQDILATGVLLAQGSESRIGNARIVNIRSGQGVASNDLGIFTIKAMIGDTLQISKEDFALNRVIVSTTDAMIIHLSQRSATLLQEVTVYGDSRLQSLKETQGEYRKNGSFYGGKPPILSVIFSPLTGFYELFGKTPSNARKYNRYLNTEIQQSTVDTKFSRYLVEKYTPLRGDEVNVFMFRYRPDYKVSKNWNGYQSIDYIKKKYDLYVKEKAEGKDVSIPDLNQIKP